MSKINILSSKIFNRIAAGEVVERPASVVKELVENSLDAGATKIFIDILDGGVSKIIITDNGCGIEKDDLPTALLPHATSKISKIADLDNIATLGFRGEALPSIASVSKLTIESISKTSENGFSIYSEGGDTKQVVDDCIDEGTKITVENLFFNTPVRAKFLKTFRSEENEISALIARFILGHPDISFKYSADNEVILQSFGDGFESAFVTVYGAKTINDCYFIDTEKNGIKINGYIGKQQFSKANRSYQTIFLNGRYILNQTISSAISNAYAPYMMKRQYPFYILNITFPTEFVDVNVHPNKIDVRFQNNQIVYSTIYSVLRNVLDGMSEALNIVVDNKINNVDKQNIQEKSSEFHIDYEQNSPKFSFDKLIFCDSNPSKSIDFNDKKLEDKKEPIVDIFAENKAYLDKLEKEKQSKNNIEIETPVQNEISIKKDLRVIGQALDTFLILEDGEDLYLIDQHAAHERLLFNKINDNFDKKDKVIQPLLVPFILNVNNNEQEFIESKILYLREMGIDIEDFGRNSFKVSSLPIYLINMNVQKFFDEILEDMNLLKTISAKDILRDKFAQKACKSAIKSGDKLSDNEIDSLLTLINGNFGMKCPHGRPICVKITRTEIDKWFKRIV